MANTKGPPVLGNRLAVVLLALTVALLIAILLVTHPIAKNVLIGLAGGPVIWMVHLAVGTSPHIERLTYLRVAAGAILIFAAFLATSAGPPLSLLFLALIAWELPAARKWSLWRLIVGNRG